jgi:hypothetical protein
LYFLWQESQVWPTTVKDADLAFHIPFDLIIHLTYESHGFEFTSAWLKIWTACITGAGKRKQRAKILSQGLFAGEVGNELMEKWQLMEKWLCNSEFGPQSSITELYDVQHVQLKRPTRLSNASKPVSESSKDGASEGAVTSPNPTKKRRAVLEGLRKEASTQSAVAMWRGSVECNWAFNGRPVQQWHLICFCNLTHLQWSLSWLVQLEAPLPDDFGEGEPPFPDATSLRMHCLRLLRMLLDRKILFQGIV